LCAGIYELTVGYCPPGVLGWKLLRSSGSRRATWSPTRWRRNGMQIIVLGFGLLMLALWAAAVLFPVQPR
jgi:hypothetical protein